jgi:hypothetical protein
MARLNSAGLLFVLVCLAASGARGDEPVATNLELVEEAARAAVDSAHISSPPTPGSDIDVVIDAGNPGAWLVQKIVNERLIDRGWDIRAAEGHSDSILVIDTPYMLRLKIVQLDLVYGRQWRRYVIGSKMVERVARASLYAELVDTVEGKIVESRRARAEVRDVVPASDLAVLSDSKYAFASPELEEGKADKYLEGGLVLAIIGVLVYLFYSNKTAS